MVSAEKVCISELDGSADCDILIGGIETEAAGTVVPITALFELDEPIIFALLDAVWRRLQGSPDRRAHCPPDALPFDMCSEHSLTMLNQWMKLLEIVACLRKLPTQQWVLRG